VSDTCRQPGAGVEARGPTKWADGKMKRCRVGPDDGGGRSGNDVEMTWKDGDAPMKSRLIRNLERKKRLRQGSPPTGIDR
jgi:hypothetical protein